MSEPDILFQEVSLRDGLQIEPVWVETDDKVRLADALSTLGFTRIEVSSFVSPKAIPALRDAEEVFARIRRVPGVIYVALVPNLRGAERALASGADELNLVMSASETHNRANMNMGGEDSFASFQHIAQTVGGSNASLNGTVATAFGCPFEGPVDPSRVLDLMRRYRGLGATGVTLADTTGMANPLQVERLVESALEIAGPDELTLHFHDTRGLGLANVLAAYRAGARRFDGSLGGLGGCPFAPGASGNISTEDAAAMAEEMGMATGIDLPALIDLSRTLPGLLGHEVPGQVMKAGRVGDLHEMPQRLRAG